MTDLELVEALDVVAGWARDSNAPVFEQWCQALGAVVAKGLLEKTRSLPIDVSKRAGAPLIFKLNGPKTYEEILSMARKAPPAELDLRLQLIRDLLTTCQQRYPNELPPDQADMVRRIISQVGAEVKKENEAKE